MFTILELQVLAGLSSGKTLASIGEELHLGQPAVSKLLRVTEYKASIPLVSQSGRRLKLTTSGEEVAQRAKQVLIQLERIEHLVNDFRSGRGGSLRLVATNTPANYLLAGVIGHFCQLHENASVAMQVAPDPDIWVDFIRGDYHLAVAPLYFNSFALDIQHLYNESITFFVSPRSKLARKERISWEELQDEILIGAFSQPYWAQFFDSLIRQGFSIGRQIDLRALEGIKRMVEAGVGIGVLFGSSVARELSDGRLHRLTIEKLQLSQSFVLVRHKEARPLPVEEAFVQFLRLQLQAAGGERLDQSDSRRTGAAVPEPD